MIYNPKHGQIKDGCMIYEKGIFFLFSMYHKDNSDTFNNIWLATSEDGVHFKDYGFVVEDFPDFIWAMKVYRGNDAFYMNSGSFSEDGKQTVLKFWKSSDLYHWEYMPDLDIEAPNTADDNSRLDCMNVVKYKDKYHGYATGQYGYLESDDGIHWTAHPQNIHYNPFPEYNKALGGFEVADCIAIDDTLYMFCGGFGHLGMSGYGVYVYKSEKPDGTFTPLLPHYRINGTSKRWVNMWERFLEKDGEYLAHNYMYNGYSYEKGTVYLPPLKKLRKTEEKLCLEWWNGNNALYGNLISEQDNLVAKSPSYNIFDEEPEKCHFSEKLTLPERSVIELNITLSKNSFVQYSAGGIFLEEAENSGSGIVFDTFGKCQIVRIKNGKISSVEDEIGFGSCAPYYIDSGKTYSVKILLKDGMFEIYVNDLYLQTFNNAHESDSISIPFSKISALSKRKHCTLSDIKIYTMNI